MPPRTAGMSINADTSLAWIGMDSKRLEYDFLGFFGMRLLGFVWYFFGRWFVVLLVIGAQRPGRLALDGRECGGGGKFVYFLQF